MSSWWHLKGVNLTLLWWHQSLKWKGCQDDCPGPRFNIKMSSYQYRKSHCGDKTILRPSYLHNGISYTGKMTSWYWVRALVVIGDDEGKLQHPQWPPQQASHFSGQIGMWFTWSKHYFCKIKNGFNREKLDASLVNTTQIASYTFLFQCKDISQSSWYQYVVHHNSLIQL